MKPRLSLASRVRESASSVSSLGASFSASPSAPSTSSAQNRSSSSSSSTDGDDDDEDLASADLLLHDNLNSDVGPAFLPRHASVAFSSDGSMPSPSTPSAATTPSLATPPASAATPTANASFISTSTARSSQAQAHPSYPDPMNTDYSSPGPPTALYANPFVAKLRASSSSSSSPFASRPSLTDQSSFASSYISSATTTSGEDLPRRAVVFSRLGGGSLKPQTRSFMRITRELADEFAPAEAEIKHEAEITMAFREYPTTDDDDEDDDEDDDDDDDEDDDAEQYYYDDDNEEDDDDGYGFYKLKQRHNSTTPDAAIYPGIAPPFSGSTSGASTPTNGLLESPPFRKRRRRRRRRRQRRQQDQDQDQELTPKPEDPPSTTTNLPRPAASAFPNRPHLTAKSRSASPTHAAAAAAAAAASVSASAALQYPPSTPMPSPMYPAFPATPVDRDRKLKRRGPVEDTIETAHSIKRRAVSPVAAAAAVAAASAAANSPSSSSVGAIAIPETGNSGTVTPGASSPTLSSMFSSSPGASLVAGKKSMKQMQETYDRIQRMSLS